MSKHLTDITVGPVVVISYLLGHMPEILNGVVALLAIGWYCVRFYDRFKNGPSSND